MYRKATVVLELEPESIESTLPTVVQGGALGQLDRIHQIVATTLAEKFTGPDQAFKIEVKIYKDGGAIPVFKKKPKSIEADDVRYVIVGAEAQLKLLHEDIHAFVIKTWV